MSKHDKIAKLKEYIKNFVIKELEKDEELDEASTTASAGAANPMGTGIHYDTPKAFSSGSAVGHKSPEVGGYKKVNESKELDTIEKIVKSTKNFMGVGKALKKVGIKSDFQTSMGLPRYTFKLNGKTYGILNKKNVSKPDRVVGDIAFGIMESINESQPFADFPQFPKLSRDQQESLDELFGFAESYQIFNSFNNNPKKFIQTLDDMAKIRKASKKQPKGVNFNKGKKQFVKEGKKRFRQRHGIGRAKYTVSSHDGKSKHKDGSDFFDINIFKNKKDLNNYMNDLRRKGYVEESINEGRYHDWRNDESMTPKQKIGRSMREIRDALNELDKTVKMNLKLKTELKMKSEDYWKNTHKALTKISERLVKMANKVGNLK